MKGPRLAACARTRWGKTAVLAALLLSVGVLHAAAREEEEYTKEWGASLGMNSLLDDTNSSIFGNPHLSMGASMRFLFNPRMALRTEMGVHFVSGDTGGVKDFYPDYVDRVGTARRFYRYSGTVFDLAALYELNFFSYAYRPGYQGHRRFTPYLQMGLGFAFSTTGRTVSTSDSTGPCASRSPTGSTDSTHRTDCKATSSETKTTSVCSASRSPTTSRPNAPRATRPISFTPL